MFLRYAQRMRSLFKCLGFVALFSSLVSLSYSSPSLASGIPTNKAVPGLNKVVWVWLENTSYQDMNAQKYVKNIWLNIGAGRFSNFKPVSKVTQANVVAMVTGSDQGITDNEPTRLFSQSIIDLLESHSIPWKVYAEDYPGACYPNAGVGEYKRYRVPFLSFSSIISDRYLCSKIQSYANFEDDRMRGTLPQFAVLIPSLKNSGATSSAAVADNALRLSIDPIVRESEQIANTTFILTTTTMVDDTKPAFAMIFGNGVNTRGTTSAVAVNHYSILKTIESGLGLGNLGGGDVAAEAIQDIWKP